MSTHQSSSNNNNNQYTQTQAPQDPTMEWTSEPLDMTSIRDDFWAFFGQTEDEWNEQMSAFPTYEEWVGQSGNAGPGMLPTSDVQMADDAAASTTINTRSIDPARRMNVANTSNLPPGSLGADYINSNAMLRTEDLTSGAAPGNGVHQASAPTSMDSTGPTNVVDERGATKPTDSTKRTGHGNRIQEQLQELIASLWDLEQMEKEARADLHIERHRCSRLRNASHGMKVVQLEALQQHEVTDVIRELERDYVEARKEIDTERRRRYECTKRLRELRHKHSLVLARLVEVEDMNLKWQDKYEAIEGRWQNKHSERDLQWQMKYKAATAEVRSLKEDVKRLSKNPRKARGQPGL
ncbi:hypothetical protein ASPCAL05989 [Aspergillus calidoustus]|uniref:Uncharacterized protein n=1 Tax=Aspergillus calidoustus TaxID=454130 RepID=A0A0U5FZ35_ASPCI|nr:hypothetical protein ASPCAL05989 [Aspergillus calidoustus]